MNTNVITAVRETQPLIHHLTNKVVTNFTANGLLSFGGIPIMADAPEEAGEIALKSDGLLLNIGTLQERELTAMIAAGKAANKQGIPVVLDPVGVAASDFRDHAVKRILCEVTPTIIKGNAGEIAHLAGIPWKTKGPDSIGEGDTQKLAAAAAEHCQTTVVITGETDVFCNGNTLRSNKYGHVIMEKITGAGCLLGSVLTACLTTNHTVEDQAMAALAFYGLTAEYAAANPAVNGSGTFLPYFIDALSFQYTALLQEAN